MNYVYIETEKGVWTVGFYAPIGVDRTSVFQPESDWNSKEEAAERVHYLNGGN